MSEKRSCLLPRWKKNLSWYWNDCNGNMIAKALNSLLIGLIRAYQLFLSPLLGGSCRFTPTCSQYGIEALRKHGPFKGFWRSEEHTSELQSLMRISYAVFCLKKKNNNIEQ